MGMDNSFRHDVYPNRLIWVLVSTFEKVHGSLGGKIEKGYSVALYDAETGDQLMGLNIMGICRIK